MDKNIIKSKQRDGHNGEKRKSTWYVQVEPLSNIADSNVYTGGGAVFVHWWGVNTKQE